jgi:hypothetical protein
MNTKPHYSGTESQTWRRTFQWERKNYEHQDYICEGKRHGRIGLLIKIKSHKNGGWNYTTTSFFLSYIVEEKQQTKCKESTNIEAYKKWKENLLEQEEEEQEIYIR